GQGVLTEILYELYGDELFVIEIDRDLIPALEARFPKLKSRIFNQDFLELDFKQFSNEQIGIIGNFPYNISSQILFKVIENKNKVPELVGMFQREVARR